MMKSRASCPLKVKSATSQIRTRNVDITCKVSSNAVEKLLRSPMDLRNCSNSDSSPASVSSMHTTDAWQMISTETPSKKSPKPVKETHRNSSIALSSNSNPWKHAGDSLIYQSEISTELLGLLWRIEKGICLMDYVNMSFAYVRNLVVSVCMFAWVIKGNNEIKN